MRVKNRREIGLAVIGCGTIGRIRATIARDCPNIGWIGLCEVCEDVGRKLAKGCGADFFITDLEELVARPDVDAVIIATDENNHARLTLAAERGHAPFIDKLSATAAAESATILQAIGQVRIDAVVGYTQRFLAVKEQLQTGQINDVYSFLTRALVNRMVPIAPSRKTSNRAGRTPVAVSGAPSLDMSLWAMEGKKPVSVDARSTGGVLGTIGTKNATFGIFEFDDGTIWSMNVSWACRRSGRARPTAWRSASSARRASSTSRTRTATSCSPPRSRRAPATARTAGRPACRATSISSRAIRLATSIAATPCGATREEAASWHQRLYTEQATPHASTADGHRNLLLTMAMDLSARTGRSVALPVTPEGLRRG